MRLRRRAIAFVVILASGDALTFALTLQYVNIDRAFDAGALFAAIATAIYSILSETTEKKRPLLRVIPYVMGGRTLGTMSMEISIANVGEAVASDVNCEVFLDGPQKVSLENNGKYIISLLAPQETSKISVVRSIATDLLQSQRSYSVKVQYKDTEGDRMKPAEVSGSMQELYTAFFQKLR